MKPRISKIISSDWPTVAFLSGVGVTIVLYFGFPLLHKNLDRMSAFWISLCGTMLVFNVIGALWRIARIYFIASAQCVVEGRVESVRLAKDRGRIDYSFTANDRVMHSWCPVHQSKVVLSMEDGQPIRVAFNPNNPDQSFVVELFI